MKTAMEATPVPAQSEIVQTGVDLGRAVRIGVINNPKSGHNRGRSMDKIRAVLREYGGVAHYEVSDLADMTAAALELLHGGAEVIAINGGDGTTHAVLTALLRERPNDQLPLLAVLPGGTTNTTANDVGTREHPTKALPRLLAQARNGKLEGIVERRSLIRIDISPDSEPFYGTVVGLGAVYHGVKYYHDNIEPMGIRGELGSGLTVATFAWKVLRGQTGTVFPPLHASGSIDGRELPPERYYGMVMATLRRIFLNLRPFWGTGPGRLQFSTLCYEPEHLMRAIWEMVREKPGPYLLNEKCFSSYNCDEVLLNIDSGFMIDGELYLPRPGVPLRMSSGHFAPFLRPL